MWKIVDTYTCCVIGTYTNLRRAVRKADRLDNEYGAYRYAVIFVEP